MYSQQAVIMPLGLGNPSATSQHLMRMGNIAICHAPKSFPQKLCTSQCPQAGTPQTCQCRIHLFISNLRQSLSPCHNGFSPSTKSVSNKSLFLKVFKRCLTITAWQPNKWTSACRGSPEMCHFAIARSCHVTAKCSVNHVMQRDPQLIRKLQ